MEKNPFVQAGALSTDLGEIPHASPFPTPFDQAGAIDGGVDQLKDSCRFIPLCQILKATNDFDDALVIGTGGFGKVYEANIDDGATTTVVAIKRLSAVSNQGAEEFWTELKLLSKFRHANLVSLIGYCNENQEMIIVYEYMTGGTLANHLYKTSTREESGGSRSHLTWEQRLNICLHAALGLDYLHNGTLHGIIHRDVKSTNILLDEYLVAKVSDFGLSKSTTHTATHVSTMVKGTMGYLDPEYLLTCRLTKKSDVFSFGVVLLEVLCGRRTIDVRLEEEQMSLVRWAQMNIKEGTLDRIIDPSLNGDTTPDSLEYFAELANECLHIQPKERPTMTEVVKSLQIALVLHERQGRSQGAIAKAGMLGGLLSRHRNPLLVPPNEIQKS
ncbi:putative receptor-like protein kinase At5g39000 [Rhododendron vialii]|uniref:putative receptor-like protein kinase At5g39000 n=1 Tax=Rhododendron vialii TaxID=182163 RepID=UPI00265DBE94|nr:putative receptor-like protein kinase At5g39000 [Rhododendron vialii]